MAHQTIFTVVASQGGERIIKTFPDMLLAFDYLNFMTSKGISAQIEITFEDK
jgi:hypothetical protein